MAWIILLIAGFFETGWALGLKLSDGFSRVLPMVLTLVAAVLSIYLLSIATRAIPVSTAYTVWAGIGAVGTIILGAVVYSEAITPARLACLGLIIVGIIGLKLVDGAG